MKWTIKNGVIEAIKTPSKIKKPPHKVHDYDELNRILNEREEIRLQVVDIIKN